MSSIELHQPSTGRTNVSKSLTPNFLEKDVVIRGTTFRLRELSAGEYDELQRKATVKTTNVLGEETEQQDDRMLLRLMLMKSVVEPRLTQEGLTNLPARVLFSLNRAVNELHFGAEPENTKSDDGGDAEEGAAKGND